MCRVIYTLNGYCVELEDKRQVTKIADILHKSGICQVTEIRYQYTGMTAEIILSTGGKENKKRDIEKVLSCI